MNNLFLETAEKKGYYTLDNLTPDILNNAWFADRLEWYKKQWNGTKLPDSLNFDHVGKFMKIETDSGNRTSMERIVILAYDGTNIRTLANYKGKFRMYPLNEDTWTYRQHLDNRDLPKIVQPNKIGVFTKNKVQDWFNYCDLYVSILKDAATANQNKESANRLIIDNFIESAKKAQPDVKVWNWSNECIVETKLFEVSFKLHDKGTYLSTDVNFKGQLNDILKFM